MVRKAPRNICFEVCFCLNSWTAPLQEVFYKANNLIGRHVADPFYGIVVKGFGRAEKQQVSWSNHSFRRKRLEPQYLVGWANFRKDKEKFTIGYC